MLECDENIKGKNYRALIELASKKCEKFAFVIRKDMLADEEVYMKYHRKFVRNIQDSFIEMKEQSEWEVNMLDEGTAYVYYYKLDDSSKRFLKRKSKSLFGWINGLPEDLTFYNGDKAWLACNSHEGYFYIDDYDSYEELLEALKSV